LGNDSLWAVAAGPCKLPIVLSDYLAFHDAGSISVVLKVILELQDGGLNTIATEWNFI
jgi:hypothetical protein